MDQILANLNSRLASKEGMSPLLVGTGKEDTHLLIVMTAERGLCGGFNSNIARRARQDIRRLSQAGKTVKILAVGRKGFDNLRRDFGRQIVDRIDMKSVKQLGFINAEEVAEKVMAMFQAGEFDVATLYYSEFQNVITQKPVAQQLIPAKLPEKAEGTEAAKAEAVYEYEPSEEEILGELLKRNIATQIFRGLLENAAGEQGARMSAMDSATRNAGDMINKMTIKYNRQRQANITKELIEIISGAEAL
jgi:F-type H+-transporting ATPase subunit gamma